MRDRLPTTWLRDVPGARAYIGMNGKLTLEMPHALVPLRRYARVRVDCGAYGAIQIDVSHEEVFVNAKPGRNAWQTTRRVPRLNQNRPPIAVRPLAKRFEDLVGADVHVDRLRRILADGERTLVVRVTPEGFQLLLDETGERLRGVGERLGRSNDLIDLVRASLNHGARKGHGPYLPPTSNHPNCRCTIKETDDMKTDLTTSDTLPFGLIAGEKIVQCEFNEGSGKDYAYFAGGLEVAEGDYVVVASPYGDGVFDEESGGYLKVVRVTSVDANPEGVRRAAKWIISKVDVAEYRDRRRKVEELKLLDEQIAVARREAMKQLELKQLMDLSPELKELITKRFEVTGISLPEAEPKA